MFTGSPTYVRFRQFSQRGSGLSWLIIAPGVALILLAVAILVWPELLAYLVASALLFAGISLTLWGWSVRRLEKAARSRSETVYYEGPVSLSCSLCMGVNLESGWPKALIK
ncbi:MAG: hypothetical protein HC802_13145 [Caldilineaceae bacterium]|nr:hypothetical protein [Caldilineaceae bacterium]